MKKVNARVPAFDSLIIPTFIAIKKLGGSGSNDEILNCIIKDLNF